MRRTTSVSTPTAHLVGPGKIKVINGRLAFSAEGQGPVRLDPAALTTVLCYGAVGVTDEAMQMLFKNEVHVAFLTPSGSSCRGRLVRSDPSSTGLRVLQHAATNDPAFRLATAAHWVGRKVQSQLTAARHYQRHGVAGAGAAMAALRRAAAAVPAAASVAQLRGVEGSASAAWFGLLGGVFTDPWSFPGRTRRPPTDPVNALLSLGYTWLQARAVARCEAAGLEVYLGTLHEYRPGRASLACDVVEPLRVPAVDRWAGPYLQRGSLTPDEFVQQEDGGFRLKPEAFGRTLKEWESHWLNEGPAEQLEQEVETLVGLIRQFGTNPSADTDL